MTETTIANLNRHGFKAQFFADTNDALAFVLNQAGNADIGIGGSVTIDSLNWLETLQGRGKVHWHTKTPEDKDTAKRANASPVYLLSANAIAQSGEIVNIDGRGNRVAAAAWGQKKVFYIAGENKIAKDIPDAMHRAKNIAAPLNAKRVKANTPCAIKTDKCYNCNSPERICRETVITTRPPIGMEVFVIILKGNWGY